MKVFVLAVSVMLITGLFVGWAGWYVDRLCGELLGLVGKLPEEADLQVFGSVYRQFEERWYGAECILKWIVGAGTVDTVEKSFLEMGVCAVGGDNMGYVSARMHLEQLLSGIREGERLSWKSML